MVINLSEQHQVRGTSYGYSRGTVNQSGNNNDAYQTQNFECTAEIQQLSDGNYAFQSQTNENDLNQMDARIIQSGGNDNYASQIQSGSGLSSVITQTGSSNYAESYQVGQVY